MSERTGVYLPKRYVPWTPFPHQLAYLSLSMGARESFTGGGVGGGKTANLLMGALQWVEVPRYHALFLRRTIGELRADDGPIMLAHEWLDDTDAIWSENDLRWTFPRSGATLTFGFMRTQQDHMQYQGAQYQTICFDELTHFTLGQYLWLFSRMRKAKKMVGGQVVPSPIDAVPIRMLTASNPGGPGHQWVKERFIPDWFLRAMQAVDRRKPVDLARLVSEPGEPKYDDSGKPRVFIPSLMEQNEAMDQEEYGETLKNLPPLEHAQLRWGDWDAEPEGSMFSRSDFRFVEYSPVPLRKIRAWDLASHDPKKTRTRGADYAAGALVGLRGDQLYLLDVRRVRGAPAKVTAFIRQTALEDGPRVPIYIEKERGGAGLFAVEHFRTTLPGHFVHAAELTGSKEVRAQPIAEMVGHNRVHLVRWGDQTPPWFEPFLAEAVNFPSEKAKRDQVDAFVHAAAALFTHQWRGGDEVISALDGRKRPADRKAA